MEKLFSKVKSAFPGSVVQADKKYVSFTFGGGLYYQLRVQKDKVRMMATNYPAKAKLDECLRLIREHGIEGRQVNGRKIIFEPGARNPEIFTLRLELPYSDDQLDDDGYIADVTRSVAGFHDVVAPLIDHFLQSPSGDLYSLMGGKKVVDATPGSVVEGSKDKGPSALTLQQRLADAITARFTDAVVKKIDKDNYLDIHLPSVHPKKGTHLGFNTAKEEVKLVFYCREDDFNQRVLANSEDIESYAQGLRIKGNPSFQTVEAAVEAAVGFVQEIIRSSEQTGEDGEAGVAELSDMDLSDGSVIDYICGKIEEGRYLTNLLYVNEVLSSTGYETDNHQAYFFDSQVLISDREMEGFLMVNLDGFYSNCVKGDEMQMIFSWGGVKDIEYEEDGDDCSIDLVADQGRLTIRREGSHSLKVLHCLYKHVWAPINDRFRDQTVIVWNQVWDMGIEEVGFPSFIDYFTFDLSAMEDVHEDEKGGVDEDQQDAAGVADPLKLSSEKYLLRFLEIDEKTGILTNEIKVEPDLSERDELWDAVRAFAERIYQIDREEEPDREELNILCFYAIVALHWCDIYVTDKRFSRTDGRFRRDVLALALCFYARMDSSYEHYEYVKRGFILPHMQFSVLLWSVNSIVTSREDRLFGKFTAEQAKEAQLLFTELDRKNQESGGYGVVSPKKMPEDHPLKAIWTELFSLFSGDDIPYQFIRDYINQDHPALNVTLLVEDRERNTAYLDRRIAGE